MTPHCSPCMSGTWQAEGRADEFTPGLVERGVEIEQRLGLQLEYNESPSVSLSGAWPARGAGSSPRVARGDRRRQAAARGDERLRAQVRGALCPDRVVRGRWQLALDLANEAHELHTRIQHESGSWFGLRALAEADLGLVEQARASAEQARRRPRRCRTGSGRS